MVALLSGVATASTVLLQLQGVANTFKDISTGIDASAKDALQDVQPGQPQTILLIGSDRRSKKAADGSRTAALSDTLMLARLDPSSGATAVLSIPRDTKAQIPAPGGGWRTTKINEAFAYGGEEYSIKAVRRLLGITINHVIIVNFNAFQRGVNYFGGLYQEVDHRFYNDHSQGGERYATIDVHAGYQLLKGGDTLDWVRYRHTDSDLVRAARQQQFLRAAKGQIASSQLFKSREDLLRIFALYAQTDINNPEKILGVLKLVRQSAEQPVRSVRFRATDEPGTTYLVASPANVATMRKEFTELRAASGVASSAAVNAAAAAGPGKAKSTTKRRKTVKRKGLATGLVRTVGDRDRPELQRVVFDLAGQMPVYYPGVRPLQGGPAQLEPARAYRIQTRVRGRSYPAYRLTYATGEPGEYWGVQGLTWRRPPILADTHTDVRRGGRTLSVYKAGTRYRMVAWRTPTGIYWVSNTISNRLSNGQMLDIAANLRRMPG